MINVPMIRPMETVNCRNTKTLRNNIPLFPAVRLPLRMFIGRNPDRNKAG